MKENTLLKIALICALVGLVILYFISTKIEFKDYKPQQLNENVGDDVKLIGEITKINQKDNVVFIEVEHQSPVTVVFFTNDKNLSLKKGDKAEIIGEVQEYKGKNEVVAQKVRIIR